MLTPEVTRKRWYILAVFYVISCNQSIFWITFSPIADESAKYFDVDYATVDLWLAWGPIIYIPVVFFLSWLQDRKGGMRHTMLLAAILDGVGMGIRCIALIQPTAWWAKLCINIAQIMNAAVGPLVMATPSKLSATWFPDGERTLATGLATTSNFIGPGFGFLYGPYVVRQWGIPALLVVQAVQALVCGLVCCAYFPAAPPHPPSASAAQGVDFIEASPDKSQFRFLGQLLAACRNPSFLLLAIIGGFQAGLVSSWTGMFDAILGPLGYSTIYCGWLGFANTIAGSMGGMGLSLLGDRWLRRRFKLTIILLFGFSIFLFAYFTFAVPSYFFPSPPLPHSKAVVMITITLAGLLLGSSNPFFYELSAELTFPLPADTSATILTLINNVGSLLPLLIGPHIPALSINMICTAMLLVLFFGTFFVRETYHRSDFDEARSYKPLN